MQKKNLLKVENLIKNLNTDIICGTAVATFIKDCDGYIPSVTLEIWDNMVSIGTLDDMDIFLDPRLIWNDLSIYDLENNKLLDLENFNVTPIELV
jgi:hypothetical protein